MDLLKVDPSKIDTLIMSHGHFDHWGGLLGFLDKHRKDLPADLTMYAGGEDNFCQRYARAGQGELSDYGMLDRRDIAKQNVKLVLCESPVVIGGQAFTTGKISEQHRKSPSELHGGVQAQGRRRMQLEPLLPAEMEGKIVPDEHIHEHATCFNLKDKGLIVISSCGHVGIVNSVRQAMEVSGVAEGTRHHGRLPPRAGTRGLPDAGRQRDRQAEPGRSHPDALQRAEFHPGSAAADAG